MKNNTDIIINDSNDNKNSNSSKTTSKFKMIVLLIIGIIISLIVAACLFFYINLSPVTSDENAEVIIFEIASGDTIDAVVSRLYDEELIKNEFVVKLYSKFKSYGDLKIGLYELNASMSADEIMSTLNDASKATINAKLVTFREGLWAKDIAQLIADNTDLEYEDIINKWNDKEYLLSLSKDYPFISEELFNSEYNIMLEGYLHPNTYMIEKDASIEEITKIFLDQTLIIYNDHKEEIEKSNMSFHEVIILASVVQYEASSIDDMKLIAGVFFNRLDINMKLQSSVTVCYALYEFDDWVECELKSGVTISPYNTYLVDGLPVGPVLNPGTDAIDAVFEPKDSDYYYFLADVYGDGTVYYSKTFEEHNKLAQELLPYLN